MKIDNLNNYKRGWVCGHFDPSLLKNNDVEIGVQYYLAGEKHESHYHAVATEINIIAYGKCAFQIYPSGTYQLAYPKDIVQVNPGEITTFYAIEDTCVVCVKYPSVPNDKYTI